MSLLHRQFLGQRSDDVRTFRHGEIFISAETDKTARSFGLGLDYARASAVYHPWPFTFARIRRPNAGGGTQDGGGDRKKILSDCSGRSVAPKNAAQLL